jgi:hypothetical protein
MPHAKKKACERQALVFLNAIIEPRPLQFYAFKL